MKATLAMVIALLSLGSPWVASGLASNAGGADKPRPSTFGDCKNSNDGLHHGYHCEEAPAEEEVEEEGLPS
ncbi:MAG TPA: hypothetical protein VFY36_06785 [Solirubrobacteraceae bacterium]|nr:hypothetical protein [Solirubrobacteraceae bacterium]